MTELTPFRIVVGCAVATAMLAQPRGTQAQVSPVFFVDDFEDMNIQDGMPVSWIEAWGTGETLDASSGDLILTPGGDGSTGGIVDGATYRDVSIRTQLRVPANEFVDVGIFARLEEGVGAYSASITGNQFTGPGVSGPGTLLILEFDADGRAIFQAAQETDLDPTQTDVLLQFDLLGDILSLTAWAEGTSKPSEPQVSVQDPSLLQGGIGMFMDSTGVSPPTPATFRFFAAVPEPSTFAITALAFLAVVCPRRRLRRV